MMTDFASSNNDAAAKSGDVSRVTTIKSVWEKLREAGLINFAKWCGAAVVAYGALLFVVLAVALVTPEMAGQFGDAFAVLTSFFNALAFAAVVATVVLQSQELEESRQELKKQAKAQEAWANAAAKQIELTKQLESVRIRPYLKLRFEINQPLAGVTLNVTNVGLGVAIIRSIEVRPANQVSTFFTEQTETNTRNFWTQIVAQINQLNNDGITFRTHVINNTNRALSPGETQPLFDFTTVRGTSNLIDSLNRSVEVFLHFESVDERCYSTETQFMRAVMPTSPVQDQAGPV